MKKSILLVMLVTTGFLCYGQNGTDSVYAGPSKSVKAEADMKSKNKNLSKAGLAEAIETGTIYNSSSPYHNVLHEFTYLVVMRDYCTKTLVQLRDSSASDGYRPNKKFSKKLKKELSNAKTELASAKYDGLKIEQDYYELFLKNINEKFKQ